jgi:hypothetical protein
MEALIIDMQKGLESMTKWLRDSGMKVNEAKNNLKNFTEEQCLSQIVKEPTWYRSNNHTLKCSLLDHIYISDKIQTEIPTHTDTVYSDHQMISTKVNVSNIKSKQTDENIWTRNWHKYNSQIL